jgi:sec-independent protein translocase protein TatA
MFGLGYQELLVILVIVLVLFGAKRLPELARSLGSSLKEFKQGINEAKAEDTTPATSKDDGGQASPRAAARACSYCKTPLDVGWSHCPRCGTAVVQGQELPPRAKE